jgi:hypothetical protein
LHGEANGFVEDKNVRVFVDEEVARINCPLSLAERGMGVRDDETRLLSTR